jgi:hypothetical protein
MTVPLKISFLILGGGLAVAASHAAEAGPFPPQQIEFFEKEIRPVLAERCYDCHGAQKHENGLRLDLRSAIIRGSDYGKVVEPGNPGASKLMKAVRHQPGAEAMPKKGEALSAGQIAALEKWIQMGLPWPEEAAVADEHHKPDPKQHWAFQPVKKPDQGVDALVGAKLKAAGLDFAPEAEAGVLCRRITVSLTGLQPTFDEIEAFRAAAGKNRQAAVEALVDRLINSPAYGERWARHWLDVARYADTNGYQVAGKSNMYPYAFTYRDWVVKSLNDDMPYDQFITYQLAADKLAKPNGPDARHLAALGFLNIGDRFISDKLLQTDDRIDVVTRGMLGLTVGCARCHDHKYDPIPSRDYYALYSVFNSSEEPEQENLPVIGASPDAAAFKEYETKVAEIAEKELDYKREVYSDMRKPDRMTQYLMFAQEAQGIKDTTAFRGRAGQLKLRDRVAEKWRDFLKRYALSDKPHPVMLAWKEFAHVPPAEFARKSPELVKAMLAPEKGLNAVARNELAKRPAPKSLEDVAAMYAEIFLTCLDGREPDNEDWKQVREVLLSEVSPMSVPVEQADAFFTRKDRETVVRIANERTKLEVSHPGAPPRAMVMLDKPKPADVRVFIRGNPGRQGEPAPRAYLTLFGGQKFTEGSGRLDLAKQLASRDNPLTARVMVNRVWAQHFGKPLVSQTSDFGVQTPKPVQAELLDYLAATFMEEGWSLKKLHRRILTSRTYQQSAEVTEAKALKDADNELLSRFNRQRLDYETMRDALLQASGDLDAAKMGGRAVALNAKEADTRRTLYLVVDRYEQATVPAMFDFANPDSHSPMRYVTNVPQQTLFLMNSPFMVQRAARAAAQTPVQGTAVDSQAVQALYRRVLLRNPQPKEVELAQRFVGDAEHLARRASAFVWEYGHGQVKTDASGRVTLADFTRLEHFGKVGQSTHRWYPTKTFPDKEYGHFYIGAGNAHPGARWPVVMKWTAPFEKEKLRITGEIKRASDKGNGVRAWIISSRTGRVREDLVPPAGAVQMTAELEVSQDETLWFVVEAEKNDTNSDGFNWAPRIERVDPEGKLTEITRQDTDFCGPDGWPLKRTKPQSPLAQLAQVLMMSNEFQFVD